jgi:glycosyltransferase involved in cell wall biosynthesis
MGLVAMEALAAGKPLITSVFPGNQEFLKDGLNAVLVPLSDRATLANRILELWENKELARTISTNGYDFIRQFDWRIMIPKLIRIWNHLISR